MSVSALFNEYYNNEFKSIQPKPKRYHQLYAPPLHQDNDTEILLKGVRIFDKTDLRSEFQSLDCPIDMILGDQDESVPEAVYPALKYLFSNTQKAAIKILIPHCNKTNVLN